MANILKFPEREEEAKRQTFLQDGEDILRFEDQNLASDHIFPLPEEKNYLEFKKARAKDWSNQELANLFRVKRLLDAAGVPNEIDRGATDEGDPWFLFCDANGEVFIHLCRLDGIYVLDSPNIRTPLQGRDFNALIEEFTNRNMPGEGAAAADRRVVRLERNGKVFLHPSTMLAALVWTLFLAAEELVMVMPEEGAGSPAPDPSEDAETVSGAVDPDITFDPLQLILKDQDVPADPGNPSSPVAQHMRDMEAFSEAKLGQNTFAIGLSAVAISLGFMTETQVSDVDVMTLENILAMISGQDTAADEGTDAVSDLALAQNGTQEFLTALTQFFDEVSLSARNEDAAAGSDADGHQTTVLTDQIEAFINSIENQVTAFLHEQVQPRGSQPSVEIVDIAPGNDATQDALLEETTGSAQEADQMVQMLSRFGLINASESLEANAREYTFDSDTVVATFHVNARDLEKASDLITGSLEAEKPQEDLVNVDLGTPSDQQTRFQAYDDEAYGFLSFLMSKEGDLEMIATNDELILLDPKVFNVALNETFAASWTLDNGEIISAIGLRSDYEAYDLIA